MDLRVEAPGPTIDLQAFPDTPAVCFLTRGSPCVDLATGEVKYGGTDDVRCARPVE